MMTQGIRFFLGPWAHTPELLARRLTQLLSGDEKNEGLPFQRTAGSKWRLDVGNNWWFSTEKIEGETGDGEIEVIGWLRYRYGNVKSLVPGYWNALLTVLVEELHVIAPPDPLPEVTEPQWVQCGRALQHPMMQPVRALLQVVERQVSPPVRQRLALLLGTPAQASAAMPTPPARSEASASAPPGLSKEAPAVVFAHLEKLIGELQGTYPPVQTEGFAQAMVELTLNLAEQQGALRLPSPRDVQQAALLYTLGYRRAQGQAAALPAPGEEAR